MKLTYKNEYGVICGSCEINLKDKEIANRASDVADLFEIIEFSKNLKVNHIRIINNVIEETICYLLGYDARKELFGKTPAIHRYKNGKLYGTVIIDSLIEQVNLCVDEIRTKKIMKRRKLEDYSIEELLEEIKRRKENE